jgi:very-short-patch-repair endonuclease
MCTTIGPIATSSALRREGQTRRQIADAVDVGQITFLRRGVYARVGACADACAAATHGGGLACISAARHEGLWVLCADEPLHVWMGPHARTHAHAGCRCVAHWDEKPTDSFGLPSVPRLLKQILACRGVEEFFVTLESALRLGRIDAKGLQWLRTHTNAAGREAIAYARRDADSGLESLLRWRLRRLGLQIRSQVRIPSVGVVDLLIGDRLIIEADGKDNHDDEAKRHRDLVRDANAASWGFITLRFDYALIVHDWETVELAILAAVDRGLHLAR